MSPTQHAELDQQVTKLIKKGLGRESGSPYVVPTLLTPKKNNTWSMCKNSKAINKITIKYWFPIPCLDNMMDVLAELNILVRLICEVDTTKSEFGNEVNGKLPSRPGMDYMNGW
jgi:hypothetical protein